VAVQFAIRGCQERGEEAEQSRCRSDNIFAGIFMRATSRLMNRREVSP